MNWININDEKPKHGETILAANPICMAVCMIYVHDNNCAPECDAESGTISFLSLEVNGRFLKNVTHFMRIRNPNEILQ